MSLAARLPPHIAGKEGGPRPDAPDEFGGGRLMPGAARWEQGLGEYVLDWDDIVASPGPHRSGLEFARSAFQHSCLVCGWNPALPDSMEGKPPPVR